MEGERFSPSRSGLMIAFAIALVSITTALVTWRASMVGSSAGDSIHKGLIDAVKLQATNGEISRKLYEEAIFAQRYSITAAELKALGRATTRSPAHKRASSSSICCPRWHSFRH